MTRPAPAASAAAGEPARSSRLSRAPDRSPVFSIFVNQVRRLAGSWRYHATAWLLIATMMAAAVTAGASYRSTALEQAAVMDSHRRELAGATVDQLAEMLQPAIKPPLRLTLLVNQGQVSTPDVYSQALSPWIPPEIHRTQAGNHLLPIQEPIDWMFVIRVVLPLCAFILGYDAVCGERRSGTLKLLLSYPVPRSKVLAGRFLALWSCLAAPLLLGALLSLLVAIGPSGLPQSADDVARVGLVVLLGLWSTAFFVLLALLVSALSREDSTSLSLLAWLWVTAAIAVPAMSGLLAHRLLPVASDGEVAQRLEIVAQRIAHEYAGRAGNWRKREWARADGFAWERVSAQVEERRLALQDEIRREALARKLAQAELQRQIAAVSPAPLAEVLAELLTGSGPQRDESFIAQARAFRATLAERVRELDAVDSESPHILFFSGYLSQRPVAVGALPGFVFHERPIGLGFAAARPYLTAFALETVAVVLACLLAFAKQDTG
ncbi:MAG TPA: ABC transporter permease subunit [Thermoanaerobaculia bacterium]|nr:ABC transporter permease subunit [Thermoanaerobaculia bacterium]